MKKKLQNFDFKKTLSSRAYTLLVCWRFKKIDEELFEKKAYNKRSVGQIQESENTRRAMHKGAIEELTRIEGFTEKEAHKMLEKECKRLIKEEIRELKEEEVFCGACRIILKRKDWEKHQEEEKLLHDFLTKELIQLQREQTLMRLNIIKDKNKEENNITKIELRKIGLKLIKKIKSKTFLQEGKKCLNQNII